MRGIDQHHVGAVSGQRPAANGSGDDPRQVQHADVFERAGILPIFGQGPRIGFADALDSEQRLRGNRLALRVPVPFVEAAHGGYHHAGVRRDLLEIQRLPAAQRALHRVARGAVARGATQQRQRAIAMVGEIGVDAHPPAIAATIDPGDRIPRIGGDAIDREVTAAFLSRVQHVYADLLPCAAALVPDFRRGQSRRRHAGLRRRAHGEGRRNNRVRTGQHYMFQRLFWQVHRAPEILQNIAGRLAGGCASPQKGRAKVHQISHSVLSALIVYCITRRGSSRVNTRGAPACFMV
ncbi:hypothetical protein D3C86_1197410 [compost metagenome]